jgi:hypothetical protein
MKKLLLLILTISTLTINAQWLQQGLDIDGEGANDLSGVSVSLSSDGLTVAIGAINNNGIRGHVRVYNFNGAVWSQLGPDIDGEANDDEFGKSVNLSSDGLTVVVGGDGNDGNGHASGHVRVFKYNGSDWIQQGVDIDGEAIGDASGWSVSISSDGSIIAIGGIRNNGNGVSAGHVRVYEFNGVTWLQKGADIDGESTWDEFGETVSLSSDGLTLASGAIGNDDNGTNSGHVRVFKYNGSLWVQQGLDLDGEAVDDYAGRLSLSSDGLTVAIGASGNDGNGIDAGHVRVFKYDGFSWVQQGSDIDGEDAGDNSGASVSLSSDGLTVAIGAGYNSNNGGNEGHVRVYHYNGTLWVQQGVDIDGEADGDLFGFPVSLSSDGSTVAIGAPLNDGNGNGAGHVRVYKYSGAISIEESNDNSSLTVFPNPTTSQLTINNAQFSISKIEIMDITGKMVETVSSNVKTIDVSDLVQGVYFLKIQTDEGLLNNKFIKQ